MSDVKHTPGPWEFLYGVNDKWDSSRVVAGGYGFSAPYRLEPGSGRDPVQDADNRLISASPDLLEACEAALAYIPNSVVRSWPPGFELKAKALELLRSAIAKATGQ